MDYESDSYLRPPVRWKLGMWAVLMTAAASAGGFFTWQFREQARKHERTATACTAALDPATSKAEACEAERHALAAKSAEATTSLAQLETSLDATRGELEDLRKWKEDTARRLQTFREMSQKLKTMVDAGKLGVQVRDGRLVMRLPEHVLFPSGSAELSRQGELALMEMAIILGQFPDRRFMVAGHSDNQPVKSGKYQDNWALSVERARVVTRFLVDTKKVKPESLVVAGYGEHDPIASNAAAEGRKDNRRIELVLLPDLSELPTLPGDMGEAAQLDTPKPAAPAAPQPKK